MSDRPLPPTFYLSITGLRIRSFRYFFAFWRHAIASKIQVDRSPGLLHSDVKRINGIQHTVTAWESQEAMKKFLYTGAHGRAMKVFRTIATGKTFGFETSRIPSWDEVHQLWIERGREY